MKFTLPLLFLVSASSLYAQMFTSGGRLNVLPVSLSTSEFGDLDNDGDEDLVITGDIADNTPGTHVYLNNGGSFTELSTSIANFGEGSVDLADFDNDGDLDMIFHDVTEVFIYRNDNLTFTLLDSDINFPKEYSQGSSIQWIDLNNDGVLEIVATGNPTQDRLKAAVYALKNGTYVPVDHNLPNADRVDLRRADFNKDGLIDLFIKHNWGAMILINKRNFEFEKTFEVVGDFASATTGDFNNDGSIDFIFSSKTFPDTYSTEIYINNPAGSFVRTPVNIPGMHFGEIEVADFNLDGLDDVFMNGTVRQFGQSDEDEEIVSSLYLNLGNLNFVKESSQFTKCKYGDVDIVDVNNDSRPDIFMSGNDNKAGIGMTYFVGFHINTAPTVNNAPGVPQVNTAEVSNDMVRITWDAPTDDTSDHLKYNVRIGTSPAQFDIVNPFTRDDHPLLYTSFTVTDTFMKLSLEQFGQFYVSVQAIDNSFRHGAHSAPVMINVVPKADFTVSSTTVCANEDIDVQFVGMLADATLTWSVDNVEFTPANNTHFSLHLGEPGVKTIKLEIESGGQTDEKFVDVVVNPRPQVIINANAKSCFQESYHIEYAGLLDGEIQYKASPAYTVVNGSNGDFLKWAYPGNHQVNFSVVYNNCATDGTVTVSVPPLPAAPEICIVTTDTVSNQVRNVIVWTYNQKAAKRFGIYRETTLLNVFEKIADVESNSATSSYIDQTSLPFQRAYRYKVGAVDTCGYETPLSMPHKTIHLMVSKGQNDSWNLSWNAYEGFYYSSYRIYRAIVGQPLTFLTQVPWGIHSYSDTNPPSQNVIYQIELVSPNICDDGNVGGRVNRTIGSTRSNVAASIELVLGVEEQNDPSVLVFPNPTTDEVTVKSTVSAHLSLKVFDAMAKEYTHHELPPFSEATIPFQSIPPGIYFLHATDPSGKKTFTKKIIKQ